MAAGFLVNGVGREEGEDGEGEGGEIGHWGEVWRR